MTTSDLPADELAREILDKHDDISPMFDDVVEKIKLLRATGLPDENIRVTIPGMYRLKTSAVEEGVAEEPAPEEIRVHSLPEKFQRDNWQ